MYFVSKKKLLIIYFNNKFDFLFFLFVDGCFYECNVGFCVGCCFFVGFGYLLDMRGIVL